MLLRRPMCIICKRRHTRLRYCSASVGICGACADNLPNTGLNFAALHSAKYIISPFFYKDELRNSILDYKFSSCYAYADVYAAVIWERISELPHLREFDMMISVPISAKRMRQRGYNQSSLVAKPIAQKLGIEFSDTALERVRHTKNQSGLNGYERAENVRNAFCVKQNITGKRIIVFDDIYTTGNTLCECARTILASGAEEVIGMTIALVEQIEKDPIAAAIL